MMLATVIFNLTIAECVQIGTFTVTTVTALVLVMTYRRNRKIELENHFFKLKMEAYSDIVFEIEKLFANLRLKIMDADSALRMEKTMATERLKELGDEIEKSIVQSDLLITKNSIYFSEPAMNYLNKFSENLYGYYRDTDTIEDLLENMNGYYDQQLELANKANTEIRKELKVEVLNKALFKRMI